MNAATPRVNGSEIRWGLAWGLMLLVAVSAGAAGVAVVFGGAAGWAAHDTAVQRRLSSTAMAIAVVTVVAATAGAFVGETMLGWVFVAGAGGSIAAGLLLEGPGSRAARVGAIVEAWCFAAVAVGAVVLTARNELAAAVSLVAVASAYDAGSHLIGTDTGSHARGAVAGSVLAVVTMVVAAELGAPPASRESLLVMAVVVACTAPLGPWLARLWLGASSPGARSVRRIDAFLVLAPAWAIAVDAVDVGSGLA